MEKNVGYIIAPSDVDRKLIDKFISKHPETKVIILTKEELLEKIKEHNLSLQSFDVVITKQDIPQLRSICLTK